MAILYDARGNEISPSFPDAITNQTVTDARAATATLAALNAEAIIDLNGAAIVNVYATSAAGNLTYVFEGTIDGVNYFALPAFAEFQLLAAVALAEQYVPSVIIATTHSGAYFVGCSGFRRVRVRVSAYTSGNVTVALRGSIADAIIYARPFPSTLHVTATAAVNTASTVTLPAAGAGMFHYITRIELIKLYSVIGVAAGAGTIITSTNLPGNPSWTTEQNATAAGATAKVIDETRPSPLKSSVANTATTLVAPAQLQTIWRWNVSYYVGF